MNIAVVAMALTFVISIVLTLLVVYTVHRLLTDSDFRQRVIRFMKSARMQSALHNPALRTVTALAICALLVAVPMVAQAQSIGIEFTEEDLAIFFTWFNTIFNALLPIALLGAGLTAGGLFVWVIANMLIRAFQGMLQGGARR